MSPSVREIADGGHSDGDKDQFDAIQANPQQAVDEQRNDGDGGEAPDDCPATADHGVHGIGGRGIEDRRWRRRWDGVDAATLAGTSVVVTAFAWAAGARPANSALGRQDVWAGPTRDTRALRLQ